MPVTEFDDSEHYGLFLTNPNKLDSSTVMRVRMSELTLAALRAAGVFDNMIDGTSPPTIDNLWLDKNFDPAVLKEWDATGASWVPMTFDRLFGRAAVGHLTVTGGTGNAVVVSEPAGFKANRLYLITPTNDNSGATTIQVSGVGTYDAKYGDGSNLIEQEFTSGRQSVLFFTGTRFEVVFSVGDLNAAVTAAIEARDAATEARDDAVAAAAALHSLFAIVTDPAYGALGDGVQDDAPAINAAIQAVNTAGGGIVFIPEGTFLIKSSINLTGCSNITIKGTGWGSTLKASADLNASDNLTKNDIITALNFSGPVTSSAGYPQKNIVITDIQLDGSLQNISGLPGGATYGYSLAGIEFLNVDFAIVERVKFVSCFGNGLVFGTQNPRQKNGAFQNGVRGCRARDNVFENCVRGLLPQYATAAAPSGITGSVIQIGSSLDGVIDDNLILKPGGPAIDIFNAEGASIRRNAIVGAGTTAVGASSLNATFYQQSIGTIRSDFGLVNCAIEDNVFDQCGGILLNGYMGANFFNDNIPTTGPVGCTIKGNKLREPTGRVQLSAPSLGASGAQYTWTQSQAGRVVIIGGTGISVTRRRGTDGSFVAQTLGADNSFPVASGDAYALTYSTAPVVVWYMTPNIFEPAIRLMGGSISGTSGQAQRNLVKDNIILNAGRYGVHLVDVFNTIVEGNVIENVGLAETGMSFVVLENTFDQAATGCQEIDINGNSFIDSRSPKFASSNVVDVRVGATVRTFKNRVINNRLETTTAASILNLSQDNYISGNFGPGWKSPVLSSPSVPASNAELLNPFPYDCDVIILGGTISAIAKGPALATQVYGATGGLCRVRQGEVIKITYTVAPTVFNWFAA